MMEKIQILMLAFVILFALYSIVQMIYISKQVKDDWFKTIIWISIGISACLMLLCMYHSSLFVYDAIAMDSDLNDILKDPWDIK